MAGEVELAPRARTAEAGLELARGGGHPRLALGPHFSSLLLELRVAAEHALQLGLRHAQLPRRGALHGGQQCSGVPAPASSSTAALLLVVEGEEKRRRNQEERRAVASLVLPADHTDGDGQISRAELAALFESVGHAATDDEVSRMMEEADADGDGCISLPEFAAIVRSADADAAAVEEDFREFRHAFRVFDADGNSLITPAGLARVLMGIEEAATIAQCRRMIQGVDGRRTKLRQGRRLF